MEQIQQNLGDKAELLTLIFSFGMRIFVAGIGPGSREDITPAVMFLWQNMGQSTSYIGENHKDFTTEDMLIAVSVNLRVEIVCIFLTFFYCIR